MLVDKEIAWTIFGNADLYLFSHRLSKLFFMLQKCCCFWELFPSDSLPLVCQMDNGTVRQISAGGLSCSQEGVGGGGTMLD